MFILTTSGQPWLDDKGQVLKFPTQEDAHRYAERVNNQIYVDYSIALGEVALFPLGSDYSQVKYIIKHL